jgi:hypothetical protein
MAKRKAQRSAKPRSGTKTRSKGKRAKPIVHHNTRAKSKQAAVVTLLEPAAGRHRCGHHRGDRLAGPFGARLSGRRGAQEARADTGLREDGQRADLSRDRAAGALTSRQ